MTLRNVILGLIWRPIGGPAGGKNFVGVRAGLGDELWFVLPPGTPLG